MLKILNGKKENVIITVSIGKLTQEDIQKLISKLEEQSEKHKTIRWYFEIEDAGSTSEKLKLTDVINLERIAIVGKKENRQLASGLIKDLNLDIRFFELQDQEKAHKWIEQD